MKKKVEEIQTTTTSEEYISGDLVFRISNVKLSEFLRFRGEIRRITGFGGIILDHCKINEIALVNENNLDRRPEIFHDAAPDVATPDGTPLVTTPTPFRKKFSTAPPEKLPDAITKSPNGTATPYDRHAPRVGKKVREFILTRCVGNDQGTIIKMIKENFKNAKYTDENIMAMYNKVTGIR